MRLLTLFPMLLSVAVGVPARASITESNIHNAPRIADVNAADWDRSAANLHIYKHVNYQGARTDVYLCRDGINSCMNFVGEADLPSASSITFNDCPDGAPNHGRKFHCFFYATRGCGDQSKALPVSGSVANLVNKGWNDKIKSVECFWNPL